MFRRKRKIIVEVEQRIDITTLPVGTRYFGDGIEGIYKGQILEFSVSKRFVKVQVDRESHTIYEPKWARVESIHVLEAIEDGRY